MSSKSNKKTKTQSKSKKSSMHFSFARLIVFLIVSAILIGGGLAFKPQLEALLNGSNQTSNASTDKSTIDQDGLVVNFIDVGQGDAIAIKFPDGKTMLIDAGPASGKQKLMEYLNGTFFAGREKVFDYLLLTHSDEDHCGGMVEVCNQYQINKIYRPCIYYNYTKNGTQHKESTAQASPKYATSKVYFDTITAFNAETSDIVFTTLENCNGDDKIAGSGYSFTFYSPTKTNYADVNDFSPVMVLEYNGKKLMFTGDADCTQVVNALDLPKVDLLKVPHHGSKYNSNQQLFQSILPKISIIQCGTGNKYGHPDQEVLNYISYVGSQVYRNDTNGNVVANVTSGAECKIDVYIDTVYAGQMTIKIEYIIVGGVLIVAYFCFGIKFEKSKSK